MNHFRWCICSLAVMALLIPLPARAQMGTNSGPFANVYIKIQVRNPDGSAATRGMLIQLESAEGGVVDQCTTAATDIASLIPGPLETICFV